MARLSLDLLNGAAAQRLLPILGATLLAAVAPALGQLSPGPLSAVHAHLEGVRHCTACHGTRDRDVRAGCLACHALIAERIATGRGLHAAAGHDACEHCHHEHQGRDFELIRWGEGSPASLDHALTGFPLAGRHAQLDCRTCHRADRVADPQRLRAAGKDLDRTYLGLPADCAGCHRDPHRATLGGTCLDCHDQQAWRPAAAFDHATATFPLTGAHARVACERCHPPLAAAGADTTAGARRFRGLDHASCAACHGDPHVGRLGADCDRCHATTSWRDVGRDDFDHDRTAFPLRSQHARVPCAGCHGESAVTRPLPHAACSDCHRDVHATSPASVSPSRRCEDCHSVQGFRPARFTLAAHDTTTFPLRGAHAATPCAECHPRVGSPPAITVPLRPAHSTCADCHRDPHGPTPPSRLAGDGCRNCHDEVDWRAIAFDHARAGWPLTGRHATASCRACHRDGTTAAAVTTILGPAPRDCTGCHADAHRGQFAAASDDLPPATCDRCHGCDGWRPSRLDHGRDTRFPLTGAHARLACDRCHAHEFDAGGSYLRYRPLGRLCTDCHGSTVPAPARKDST